VETVPLQNQKEKIMFTGLEGRRLWKTVITIAAVLGIGFIAGNLRAPKVKYVDVVQETTVTKTDTVWLEKPVVHYVTKVKYDTLVIEVPVAVHEPADTSAFQIFARTSQALESDDVQYGTVDVEYVFPPWDQFNIDFHPAPLPTVTKTVTVREVAYRPATTTVFDTRWVNFAIGCAFGAVTIKYYIDRR